MRAALEGQRAAFPAGAEPSVLTVVLRSVGPGSGLTGSVELR
jgi:hypothetical protein